MSRIIALSEAASIAIHSLVLIARSEEILNVVKISEATGSSKHHVAKVLQRLVKDGYLSSNRGPSGGFALKKNPEDITLLNIFETIEGKMEIAQCPMDNPVCPFEKCLMGNIVPRLTEEFRNYMAGQTVKEFIE
jgi:Rrf2 family protein